VVVDLGTAHHRKDLKTPTRLVTVRLQPHPKRPAASGAAGGAGGDGGDGDAACKTMVIATDRLDLPAEVIGLIYQRRWQVELFFRFFKHVLGCRHLLSHCENGIRLQVYAAIIACLLIALYTGRKPSKATAELMGWYLLGLAQETDLQRHLGRLKTQA
jgi:IS4 transposase